jgi:hypothetical protein
MTSHPRKPHDKAARHGDATADSHDEQTAHAAPSAFEEAEQATEDTAEDVLHAFRKGRADAIAAAERTVPVVKRSVAKGIYVCCYYLAFGAVYSAELAMATLPEDSSIRLGFRDGAAAASDAYAHRGSADEPLAAEPAF